MSFPEAKLRTGLPATEAKAFAVETTLHPEWVYDLIRISAQPEGGTVPRKWRRGFIPNDFSHGVNRCRANPNHRQYSA